MPHGPPYSPRGYVALCPEVDIASQGDTVEQARASLKEALEDILSSVEKVPLLGTRVREMLDEPSPP